MQISWNNIKGPFNQCFTQHENKSLEDIKRDKAGIQNNIKNYFYRHCYRNVPRSQTTIDEGSMQEWNTFAFNALDNPESGWDIKKLQLHRAGQNKFVTKGEPLLQNDKIISIYHKVRDNPVGSRINVVVSSRYAGAPLYDIMKDNLKHAPDPIVNWKVMNPEQGSNGPDSAVIYCTDGLGSSGVSSLITQLTQLLSGKLESIPVFGLQKFSAGIYGCDLPSIYIQTKLDVVDNNSAGEIISAILAKACCGSLKYYKERQKITEFNKKGIIQDYFKEFLGSSWTLVN